MDVQVPPDSGLSGYTPADVYGGLQTALARTHQAALTAMYERHPERFVHKPPAVTALPMAVEINPVAPDDTGAVLGLDRVNVPTLPASRRLQENTLT